VLKIDTGEATNNTVQNDCASQRNDDASHPNDADRHQDACMVLNKYHSRTKHIDVQHHFVRECVKNNSISLSYVPTTEMAADMLTKALPRDKHHHCVSLVGMHRALHTTSGSVET
jgi:hypothetical protein